LRTVNTTVDFIARGSTPEEWKMVLVESGPWHGPIDSHLRNLQERLYGCVDAALDGQLAGQFPESAGKSVVIQLDCYNLPKDEVQAFFTAFARGVFSIADYRVALAESQFVKGISFDVTFDSIH
jgi:hypothetical protein